MVVGDISTGTNVVVIGGGPAGYTAAIRAAQLNLDVALVERDAYGGACLNHGCIPSKALITATTAAYDVAGDEAEKMGIHADPVIDLEQMIEWKDGIVSQLTGGVEKLCKANGINLVKGTAAFVDDNRVRVAHSGDGQGSESIEFEHAIIATGARSMTIPNFDFSAEPVVNSRQALGLTEIPKSLMVVGAGYIGMELASAFAKLGTDVIVVEMLDSILPGYSIDLIRPVKRRADALGITFFFERSAVDWQQAGDDSITVITESSEGAEGEAGDTHTEMRFEVEKVLVAVGREPMTDALNLDAIGLEPDNHGFIETDDQMRTAVDHVFAVGDVTGEPMLAHVGSAEGIVAAEVIAGEPVAFDNRAIPAVVYTDPEIATVGMTETEANAAGYEPIVGRFPFQASGRALTTPHPSGFVRIVAEAEHGFVLGGQIVGPEASELIAELGLAIEMGATVTDIAATMHAHPTLAEAIGEAADNALGRAIHTLNR